MMASFSRHRALLSSCALLFLLTFGYNVAEMQDWMPLIHSRVAADYNRQPPKPVKVVWHHGQTVGLLTFAGELRTLDRCRLTIIEKVEKEAKERVLADLSRRYPITEVDFDVMLSVVQDCNTIQQSYDRDIPEPPLAPVHPLNVIKSAAGPPPPQSQHAPRRPPSLLGKTTKKKKKQQPLSIWSVIKGIVPGTKWCGVNDIANDYHDLGKDFALDKCCRAHDHCPIKIKPFSENFGIRNVHPYTKSHCACDNLFYKCLKDNNDDKSLAIGNLFYNVLGLQCAQPKVSKICVKKQVHHPDRVGEAAADDADIENEEEEVKILGRKPRFLFNLWGSRTAKQEECLEWRDDPNAPPKIEFVKPTKKF